MTITIQNLRFAGTDGAAAAGRLLAKVSDRLYHHGASYCRKVMLPLRQRKDWTGAGQPQAEQVVAADGVAIYTAASRIRLAANTMQLFAATIDMCKSTVDTTMTKAENKGMTVDSHGTVTPGDDATDDDKDAAKRYTKTLHKQLAQARHIDRMCADTLRRLCGHKAHGHDGYALPVYATRAGDRLYHRSAAAYNQPYTPSWKPYDFRFQPGRGPWWSALGSTFAPCVLGQPSAVNGGGGFIVGPDMRLYPIATVTSTHQTDGQDGWHTLFTRSGHADFAPNPTEDAVNAGLILLGALAGADYGQYRGANEDLTDKLQPVSQVPTALSRSSSPHYPTRPTYDGGTLALIPFEVGGAVGDGVERGKGVAARHYYAYQTVFQQNDAGQTRAVIKTYQVSFDADGTPTVSQTDSYLDRNGTFKHVPFHEPTTMHAPRQFMLPDGTVITV